jgi:SAM-dependent methyltransferase
MTSGSVRKAEMLIDPATAEAIEEEFWKSSPVESPGSDSIDNILMKAAEARVFMEKLNSYADRFASARKILELGGGQCWASCMVKRFYPGADVTATDLSEAAVLSVTKWLPIFGSQPDRVQACRAYDTPFENDSFDLIFAFAAAHHFRRYGRSMAEIARILAPGGTALFFHEPSCTEFLYRPAVARVNKKRPEVPEDVLVRSRLARLAKKHDLSITFKLAPTMTNRDGFASTYYLLLNKLKFLQHSLPCTADIILEKPPLPGGTDDIELNCGHRNSRSTRVSSASPDITPRSV